MGKDSGERRRKRLKTLALDLQALNSPEAIAEELPKENAQANGHLPRTEDEIERISDEKTSARKKDKRNMVLRSHFVGTIDGSATQNQAEMKDKKALEHAAAEQLGKEADTLLLLRHVKDSGGAGSPSDIKKLSPEQANASPGPAGTMLSGLLDDQEIKDMKKGGGTDEFKEELDALDNLNAYISVMQGELGDGWQVEISRKNGRSDKIFISPDKQRFRSRREVARFLGVFNKMRGGLERGKRSPGREESGNELDVHAHPRSQAFVTPSPAKSHDMQLGGSVKNTGNSSGGHHDKAVHPNISPAVHRTRTIGHDSVGQNKFNASIKGSGRKAGTSLLGKHHGKEPEVSKPESRYMKENREKEELFVQLGARNKRKTSPSPALASQRCRDVLCHIVSTSDFGTLCSMFQGAPLGILENGLQCKRPALSGGSLDFQLVALRMAAGAYGETPDLFLTDMQQVWRNILSVGNELVRLAESLSKLSENLYKEQVLSLFSVEAEDSGGRVDDLDGTNPLQDDQLRMHTSQPERKRGLHSFQEVETNSHKDHSSPRAKRGSTRNGIRRQNKVLVKNCNGLKTPKTPKARNEERACRSCGLKEGTDCLICSTCNAGYHTYCLTPTLTNLPDSAWYCPTCASTAVWTREANQSDENRTGFNGGLKELSLIPEQSHEQVDQTSEAGRETLKITSKDGMCKACGKDDNHVLLCDSCDAAYHMHCLTPPLDGVPDGNWYCPLCVAARKGPKELHVFYKVGDSIDSDKLEETPHHCAVCDRIGGTAVVPVEQELVDHPVAVLERVCKICGVDKEKESIVSCDACAKLYHMTCLKPPLKKFPTPIWYCPSCLCRVCKVDDHDEMILLCDACDEGYHTYCLSPPLADIPEGSWFCPTCALSQALSVRNESPREIVTNGHDSLNMMTLEAGRVELPKRKRKSAEPKRAT